MAWARIRDANRTGTPWRSGNRRSTIDNRQSAIRNRRTARKPASTQARKPASTQARKRASAQARKRASAPDSGNLRTIRRKTRRRDDAATRGGYAL
ncbi:hypothetical protein PTBPS01_31140 [Burkholderia pseudomallei]|nr:hypothetical protein PTBPS01_31140 [Burkholderia pseudomallei]